MDLTKRVGINIRAIRKSQNMTIDDLADKCDFQSPYLSDIERGERNITLHTLTKIIDALNVDAASILIPGDSNTNLQNEDELKEELIQLLVTILKDRDANDVRMILNISNDIFKRYKTN